MTRRLALLAAVVVCCSFPLFAQHPPDHQTGRQHGPHTPMDPKLHAAMHALILGDWVGTFTTSDHGGAKLSLTASQDKQGQLAMKLASAQAIKLGTSRDVDLGDHAVAWTQDMNGTACKATGTLTDGSATSAPKLAGRLTCGKTEIPFALEKSVK